MTCGLSKLNKYNERNYNIMAIAGMCPYFKKIPDDKKITCECAKFTFPDRIARRDLLYGFCAHPTAYKNCILKQSMDKYYYERKYDIEKGKQTGA